MIVGVFEEARRGVSERRVGFEPSRAERVRIWAVCLTLGALAQLGVVAALMPIEAPRYVVQLEKIERRPMFVPARFDKPEPPPEPVSTLTSAAAPPAPSPLPSTRPPSQEPRPTPPPTRPRAPRRASATPATSPPPSPTPSPAPARTVTPTPGPDAPSGEPVGDEAPVTEGGADERSAASERGAPTTPEPAGTAPRPRPELTPEAWAKAVGSQVSRGLRYPRDAEDDGVEGLAVVRLTIAADGLLVGAELIRSAGDPRLDEAALSRARSVGRFPTPPGGLRTVDVPVRFRLP